MTPAWRDAGGSGEPGDRVWGGRRWSAVGAVVFLVFVLALVIGLLVKGHPAQSGRRAGAAPADAAATGASAAAGGGVPLAAAPVGVAWRLVDGVALPFSASDGPRSVVGGVASGFSRTPAGALLACVQTALRIGNINPSAQASVVSAMVIGAGRAGLLASRPATVAAVKPQMAGFRYVSYTPAQAVIGLAWRVTDVASGTAQLAGIGEFEMTWSGGDWRLVDDGSQAPLATALDAGLTGYVPFSGV